MFFRSLLQPGMKFVAGIAMRWLKSNRKGHCLLLVAGLGPAECSDLLTSRHPVIGPLPLSLNFYSVLRSGSSVA